MASSEGEKISVAKESSRTLVKVVMHIVLYVVVSAVIQYILVDLLPMLFGINVKDYLVYVNILLSLAFGYLIVSGIANFIYWTLRVRHPHPTAAAVRNVIKIIGIGGLAAAIAGGVAGGAAGVALGGFLGMVIGFATQQVLGQAVSGLFVLIVRPFKIGDSVNIVGEDGVVENVATLFTIVVKEDGTRVLIPNNSVIGGKIYVKKKA
ncbi:MAG: mechanosensitive ion channel [Thermoproteota archaeon]